MIIYEANINDFFWDIKNKQIVARINYDLKHKFGIRVAENEQRSWSNSLPEIAKLLLKDQRDHRRVLCEFNVPCSKKRIDLIVLGTNQNQKPSGVIIELKQWSDVTELEWNTFQVGKYNDSHPSEQAQSYKELLNNQTSIQQNVDLLSVAYLHNLKNKNSPLLDQKYAKILKEAKLYHVANKTQLAKTIDRQTIIRESDKALDYFKEAKWAPSKKFNQIVAENFQSIKLVGSQKTIYEKIERFVRSPLQAKKMTFLISGDPGSGKTIIAFKLLNLLTTQLHHPIQLMVPGQEVRAAFKKELGKYLLASKISGSNMWKGHHSVIIDEGHKAISRDTGRVNYQRNFAKIDFAVIFVDDDQVINRKGITKQEIKEIAASYGHVVHEYEVAENFRAQGERVLLDWIDHTFYQRETRSGDFTYQQINYVNANLKYKLKGYKKAHEFTDAYFELRKKQKSTRIVSLWHRGYYIGPADEDGFPKATFKIGTVPFVWNPNAEWKKKLETNNKEYLKTYNSKVKELANDRSLFLNGNPDPRFIAYFNHIQGYEFEHIFVYIPKVFTYRKNEIIFHRDELAVEVRRSQTWSPTSKSKGLKGQIPYQLNKRYFLNRIKVMLTRGVKSTHVFVEDQELNNYILNKII